MFDLAVIGSGFAGSLTAMIAHKLGLSVILLERAKHPRFAIGESSTPLSNLLLEELATRYHLPMLLPFARWGTWQRGRPQIACGLKRGFSFFHHKLGERWSDTSDRGNQLLVGASPNEDIADTHWYRPEFDQYFSDAAAELGVTYVDEVQLQSALPRSSAVTLQGTRCGHPCEFEARFVIDASGPRGFLHRTLKLGEKPMPNLPSTETLYAHFTGVRQFADVADTSLNDAPYPVDDAAVHHVFDGGWIWVLRFNNGLTSAGIAAIDTRARNWRFEHGMPAWKQVLDDIPLLGEQFSAAQPATSFFHSPKLAMRSASWAGDWWIQLPSAAGFIDPLLSTGFPLTLLGVERIAHALEDNWGTDRFRRSIQKISQQNESDFRAAERLIAALYAQMHDFSVFRALTLLYFAAASFSESARRLGHTHLCRSFLLRDDPTFENGVDQLCSRAIAGISSCDRTRFVDEVTALIDPINIAGLGRADRQHWYPADSQDLLDNCHKLAASRPKVLEMLQRLMLFSKAESGTYRFEAGEEVGE